MSARTGLWALCLAGLCLASAAADEDVLAIEAGKVLTMNDADEVLNNAVVLIRGGKIAAVGRRGQVQVPAGARVIDAHDRWVLPGFVDCHNHSAGSLVDLNDGVWLTNPGLRTVDTVSPMHAGIKEALSGGVTTVLLLPGSGTNMSGFGTVLRLGAQTVDEMVLRAPGSLKIAQAGNPESYWFRVGRSYMNWNLRQTLKKAQAYDRRWTAWERDHAARGDAAGPPPGKSLFWEGFRAVFRGQVPVTVHTQMFQVVMKTVEMLKDEFHLEVVLDHSTFDGYKIAPLVVDRDLFTIVGPRQYFFDRTQRRLVGCAARWYRQGVRKLGINTDSPVVPEEELSLQAALGCRFGLDPYVALKGLTIVPARALKVDDLVGSLEVGKDADVGIWTGDPLDPRSTCEQVLARGRLVHDASQGRRF